MVEERDIEVVVFDVLGTMVDEPGGLRAAIREAVPASDDAAVDRLYTVWREHVDHEQLRIAKGSRAYADSDIIDREAAQHVADSARITGETVIERLATASRRLQPWDDSLSGLRHLTQHFPVLGLTHASRTTLLRLNAYAGLRWHQALSAEDVRACKPAPEVYRMALDAANCPPERVLMVAAHAWDLRGAQTVGMRTAYVRRPGGDPPQRTDAFNWRTSSLHKLAATLTAA